MTTQQQFNIGDLVELKSGGPVMTIKYRSGSNNFACQWFAGKKLEQGDFPPDSLKPAVLKPAVPLASDDK